MQAITDETGSLLTTVATSAGGPAAGLAVNLAVGVLNALIARHGSPTLQAMTREDLQAAIQAELDAHVETPAEALERAGGAPEDPAKDADPGDKGPG